MHGTIVVIVGIGAGKSRRGNKVLRLDLAAALDAEGRGAGEDGAVGKRELKRRFKITGRQGRPGQGELAVGTPDERDAGGETACRAGFHRPVGVNDEVCAIFGVDRLIQLKVKHGLHELDFRPRENRQAPVGLDLKRDIGEVRVLVGELPGL